MKTTTYPIHHHDLTRATFVFALAAVGLAIYLLIGFGVDPDALIWPENAGFGLVLKLLVDYYLVECVSIYIVLVLVRLTAKVWQIDSVTPTPLGIGRYLSYFIPTVILAIAVFMPITQGLRHLIRQGWHSNDSVFYAAFNYQWSTFIIYLGVLLPLIGVALMVNLVRQLPNSGNSNTIAEQTRIIARGPGGKYSVRLDEVQWAHAQGRKRLLETRRGTLTTQHSLRELNELLGANFFQINRSQIVARDGVHTFAPFQKGEYVLRLKGASGSELIVSRRRAAGFKRFMSAVTLAS